MGEWRVEVERKDVGRVGNEGYEAWGGEEKSELERLVGAIAEEAEAVEARSQRRATA